MRFAWIALWLLFQTPGTPVNLHLVGSTRMTFTKYTPFPVDYTKVNTGETGFPVLISVTDNRFKDTNNGGIMRPDGYDIYWYSDSPPATRIPTEREYYNGATGQIVFWAKRTTSNSEDAMITAAYGDSGIVDDPNLDGTYGATSVWDANFKGVYHHSETGANPQLIDSTSNAKNSSTNLSDPATGKIAGGMLLTSANSDYAVVGDAVTDYGLTTALTVSFWLKSATTQVHCPISDNKDGPTDLAAFEILDNNGVFWGRVANGSGTRATVIGGTWSSGTFYLVTLKYDGSNVNLYSNASTVAAQQALTGSVYNSTVAVTLGKRGGYSDPYLYYYYDGIVDELRISDIARSASWIADDYASQNSPTTFAVMGTEVALGGILGPLIESRLVGIGPLIGRRLAI